MFKELYETFAKVVKLAEEKNKEYRELYPRGEECIVDISDIEELKYSQKEKELFDYLDSLDFETVKIIQTIMYLGRDHDYCKEDSFEIRYDKYRKYHELSGWNEKEVEIMQMVQKIPLDTYLRDGFKILGINI